MNFINTIPITTDNFTNAYRAIDPEMEARHIARKRTLKRKKVMVTIITMCMLIVATLFLMICEYIHRGYFAMGGEVFAPFIGYAVIKFCESI